MSNLIYEIKNLVKMFGEDESLVKALNGVSLDISEGEFVAIMGPSGCGKTTLLNILAGLIPATSGSLLFEKGNILEWDNLGISAYRNQSIGYVMQNFGLINNINVYKNVELPIKRHCDRKKTEVNEALKRMKIDMKKKAYPFELSGGQKQRVAIARALINNPRVILADEPTGALDIENSQMIMEVFKEVNKSGITIILVTHDERIANQCNRIIRLVDGRVLCDVQVD